LYCSNLTVGPQPDTSSTANAADVAGVITSLKQRYNLKHVYAWHAILGYWSGVSPNATAAAAAAAAAAAGIAAAGVMGGVGVSADASDAAAVAAAATKELAAAAAGFAAGSGKAGSSSSSSSSGGMASSIVLPRVSAAMTDLEPPCNWSQLVGVCILLDIMLIVVLLILVLLVG
jgi:hypothetical protein